MATRRTSCTPASGCAGLIGLAGAVAGLTWPLLAFEHHGSIQTRLGVSPYALRRRPLLGKIAERQPAPGAADARVHI